MRHHMKLAPRFYDTFLEEAKIKSVAYCLSLPHSSRMHPVFHVSKLEEEARCSDPTHPHSAPRKCLRGDSTRTWSSLGPLPQMPQITSHHRGLDQVGGGSKRGQQLENFVEAWRTIPTPCGQGSLNGRDCYVFWVRHVVRWEGVAWRKDGRIRRA